MTGIYAIQNKINNKIYIGQSIDIERRWNDEKKLKKLNKHLKRSFIKYGINNFEFFVLEECSKEQLNEKEIYYIKLYNSLNPKFGYNKTSGGDSAYIRPHSYKLSEEHKRKISEANKNYKPSKEALEKQSKTRQKNLLEKHKFDIWCYETQTMYSSIEEIIEKLLLTKSSVFACLRKAQESTNGYHICYGYEKDSRNWNFHPYKNNGGTKNWHNDTIEKFRQYAKTRKKSNEEIEKLRKANLGKKLSEEVKRKISQSRKGKKNSEECRKHISESKIKSFRIRATTKIHCIETNDLTYTIDEMIDLLKDKYPKLNRCGIGRVLKKTQITCSGLHFERIPIGE